MGSAVGAQLHGIQGAAMIAEAHLCSGRVVHPPFQLACPRAECGFVVRGPKIPELRHDDAHGVFARLDSLLGLALPQQSLEKRRAGQAVLC